MPPLRGSEFGALRPPQTLKARAFTMNSRPDLLEPELSRMPSTSEAFAQIAQSQNRVDKCKIDDAVVGASTRAQLCFQFVPSLK